MQFQNRARLFLVVFIACTLCIGTVSASWAYRFVVNDGRIYVTSEEQVDSEKIGSNIGEVTKYSDLEGTYSGNFSNQYPKGTKYYEIIGIEIKEAIAVRENEKRYVKATYGGEYAGGKNNGIDFIPYIVLFLLVLFTGYYIKKRLHR